VTAIFEAETILKLNLEDIEDKKHIAKLVESFKIGSNYCLVFEKYGPSLYEHMKANCYKGYTIAETQVFLR
jgi:dual-specificity kinase